MSAEVKYIFTLANIGLAILFLVILNSRIYAASHDLNYDQRFFARDIAYTIDAMQSVNGEVEAHFVIDEELDVKIENGYVFVYYKMSKEAYPYIQDSKYSITYKRDGRSILIHKIENPALKEAKVVA